MRVYEFKCACGRKAEGSHTEPPLCVCGNVMIRDWTTNIIFKGADFTSNANRPDYTEI